MILIELKNSKPSNLSFELLRYFFNNEDVDKDEAETTPSAVDVPKINVKVSMPGKDEKSPVSLDLVEKYMHLPVTGDYDNEHDMYELAKKQMLASQHDSVTKVSTSHRGNHPLIRLCVSYLSYKHPLIRLCVSYL